MARKVRLSVGQATSTGLFHRGGSDDLESVLLRLSHDDPLLEFRRRQPVSIQVEHTHKRTWFDYLQVITTLVAVLGLVASIYISMVWQREWEIEKARSLDPFATAEGVCSQQLEFFEPEEFDANARQVCLELGRLRPSAEVQRELVRLLIDHPDQEEAILASWVAIYPQGREWINDLAAAAGAGG
jgi:hypothetical protein